MHALSGVKQLVLSLHLSVRLKYFITLMGGLDSLTTPTGNNHKVKLCILAYVYLSVRVPETLFYHLGTRLTVPVE